MGRDKRIWYLSPMRAAKVQTSLRIRAVSPEPSLLAHTSSESRGTFRQKARSLAPLNGWACAVEIRHDGMLEDTNSLDGAQMRHVSLERFFFHIVKDSLVAICWETAALAVTFAVLLYVMFLSRLVSGAGCGIRLYRFLISAVFIYF